MNVLDLAPAAGRLADLVRGVPEGLLDGPTPCPQFLLDELVIHGWDVARASKQVYDCDRPTLEAVHGFLAGMSDPGQAEQRQQIFGPVVAVPDDTPMLDRVIGLSGRQPTWSP